MRSVIALVPMRHASERVPGKNFRLLAGVPLYHHIVHALLQSKRIARILIDTDSPTIAEDAAHRWEDVTVIDRPPHLRDGDVPMNDVIAHDLTQVDGDFFLQTHSTNPLTRPQSIAAAVDRFFDRYPEHDSLFSVTRRQVRLWNAAGTPLNHDPSRLVRTQDLEPFYEENSNLYLFSREGFAAAHGRIGRRPALFELDRVESWDIDDEEDFRIVDALCSRRAGQDA